MRIYDSLSRTVKPIPEGKTLSFYSCGVTVYDYCHVGHARSYLVWDVLKRWLQRRQKVVHVQNFTDVDDKIVNRAAMEGVSPGDIAARYIQAYHEDMDWLNVSRADLYPLVSALMPEMLDAARRLVALGNAYESDGDIRFKTHSHAGYGKLSGRQPGEDFALWKGPKPTEPDFPLGRPGWHLECSVMIERTLGNTIDIHAGGNDLIFPHHENEIAQSECLHNAPLANHWLHNGMVEVSGNTMGKSKGNASNIRDYRNQGMDPNVIRYWVLQGNYRKPLSKDSLDDGTAHNQWTTLRERLRTAPQEGITAPFVASLDEDFNTSSALSSLLTHPSWEMANILGFRIQDEAIPADILALFAERNRLRAEKRWKEADTVKQQIIAQGFQVRDNQDGSVIVR